MKAYPKVMVLIGGTPLLLLGLFVFLISFSLIRMVDTNVSDSAYRAAIVDRLLSATGVVGSLMGWLFTTLGASIYLSQFFPRDPDSEERTWKAFRNQWVTAGVIAFFVLMVFVLSALFWRK